MVTKIKKFSMKEALKKMRYAFRRKVLGCQTGKKTCMYTYRDGTHCIIGSIFNKGQLALVKETAINSGHGIHSLITKGVLKGIKQKQIEILRELQWKHDDACQGDSFDRKYRTNKLGEMLNALCSKYHVAKVVGKKVA